MVGIEKRFFNQLLNNLPLNPNILDFGCGNGLPFDKYLIQNDCKVTGIDLSEDHIKRAKRNVPEAEFICGDFSNYSFDRTFDAIISLYAIFHIPRSEHEGLFKKIRKLLHYNGYILVTLGAESGEFINENWSGTKMAWSTYGPETYIEVLNDLNLKGFEGEAKGEEEYHFWVLAQKV